MTKIHPVQTYPFMNFSVTLEREKVLEEKLLLYLEESHPVKFATVTEMDLIHWLVSKKKRSFLEGLDWVYPRTGFLRTALKFYLSSKDNRDQLEKIESSRLFINLVGYCFKHQFKVCFIGPNFQEESHLRRNFKFIFPKLSDISFFSAEQFCSRLPETIAFLQKSNYRLIVISDNIRYFKENLGREISGSSIFFDAEALSTYSQKKSTRHRHRLGNRILANSMLKFLSTVLKGIGWLLKTIFFTSPIRLIILLTLLILKQSKRNQPVIQT